MFEDSLQLELSYMTERRGSKKDWFLGWRQQSQSGTIDAQSGDFIDYTGAVLDSTAVEYEPINPMDNGFEKRTSTDLLSSEEAAAIVEEEIGVPEGRTLENPRMGQYWNMQENNEVWSLQWRNRNQMYHGPFKQTSAAVDARTGQIYEYREEQMSPMQDKASEEEPSISKEEVQRIAIEFVHNHYPNASERLKQREMHQPVMDYGSEPFSFSFTRFFKDRPVEDGGVHVTLDGDGQIVSYRAGGEQGLEEKLEKLEPVTTEIQARNKWLAESTMKLQFVRSYSPKTSASPSSTKAKLVYQVSWDKTGYGYAIDAGSGEWRTPGYFEQEDVNGSSVTDIEGHWAEKQLTTLLQYGILKPDDEGRLQPDDILSKGEWYEMLAQAGDPYFDRYYNNQEQGAIFADVMEDSEYYPALNWAVQREILGADSERAFNPEGPLSRADFAVQLVQFLRYSKLSEYMNGNTMSILFQDVSDLAKKDKGAVLIALSLGLLTTSNNNEFYPNREVTRAEASVVLMRLVYLQGKTDQR
jgi:hypothetical protein